MRLSGYQKKANLTKKAVVSRSMNLINFLNLLLGSTAVLSTIKVLYFYDTGRMSPVTSRVGHTRRRKKIKKASGLL
jgi:hypothetical protein